MAIFRVMRIGGKALFLSAPAIVIVPPPVVVDPPPPPTGGGTGTPLKRYLFEPMRAANGVALLRGAQAGTVIVVPPDEPPPVTTRFYEEEFRSAIALTYDAGDSNAFSENMQFVMGFGFAIGDALEVSDTMSTTLLLDYNPVPQVSVTVEQTEAMTFAYLERARIRGWNDEPPLPPRDWTPDPKPNLF